MATADDYAKWIVDNADKKGSAEFNTVAQAYKQAKETETTGGDMKKYQDHPISTFAANAVNALTFGLPDYLNKTFTPEDYSNAQFYNQANPMAANLGSTVGEAAGYAVPGAYGAVKGAQLGARGAGALLSRYAPDLSAGIQQLGKLYGGIQGAATGGTMGAQAGAAVPGVIAGNPAQAVAAPELVNQVSKQMPFLSPLNGVTGHVVPAAAGAAASMVNSTNKQYSDMVRQNQAQQDQLDMAIRLKAAKKVLGQP